MNQSPDARRWTKGTKCASKSTGLCCPEIARSESTALSRTTVSSTVANDSKGGCNTNQTPCPGITIQFSEFSVLSCRWNYWLSPMSLWCNRSNTIIYSAFIRGFRKNGNTMEHASTINRLSCLMKTAQDNITTYRHVINPLKKQQSSNIWEPK